MPQLSPMFWTLLIMIILIILLLIIILLYFYIKVSNFLSIHTITFKFNSFHNWKWKWWKKK